MTEIINAKVVNHHALEKDWQNIDYIPEVGEIVFYDAEIDENGQPDVSKAPEGREPIAYTRQKNGDGVHNVKDLPFASVEGGDAPSKIVQSDWNEKDEQSGAFIKNKPEIPTIPEAIKNPNAFELFDNNGLVGEYDGSAPMTLVAGNNIVLDVVDAESNIVSISAFGGEGGGSSTPADGTTYGLVRGGSDGDVQINQGVITLNQTDGLVKTIVEEISGKTSGVYFFDYPHPEAQLNPESAKILEAQGIVRDASYTDLDTEELEDESARYIEIGRTEDNQYFDFPLSFFTAGDEWPNLPADADRIEYIAKFTGVGLKAGSEGKVTYDEPTKEWKLSNGVALSNSNLQLISSTGENDAIPDILRLTILSGSPSSETVECWFSFVVSRMAYKNVDTDQFSGIFSEIDGRLRLYLNANPTVGSYSL